MRRRKKAKNGAGSIDWRGTGEDREAWVRVSAPGKPRKRIPIANSAHMSDAEAAREGRKLAADYRAGRIVFDENKSTGPLAIVTVNDLVTAWTSGKLYATYGKVNKLRPCASDKINKWTLSKHVIGVRTRGPSGPTFGELRVVDVTENDAIKVIGAQPKDQRAQTLLHTYQRMRRIFDLAIFPLKMRREGDNPISRRLRPERDAEKEFSYLWPDEFAALMKGTNDAGETVVPLPRRVLYAIAVYSGFRKESLLALTWKNFDAANRVLVTMMTKSKRACFAEGEPAPLFPFLSAWREHLGNPDDSKPIVDRKTLGDEASRLAGLLRADLAAVGTSRGPCCSMR